MRLLLIYHDHSFSCRLLFLPVIIQAVLKSSKRWNIFLLQFMFYAKLAWFDFILLSTFFEDIKKKKIVVLLFSSIARSF